MSRLKLEFVANEPAAFVAAAEALVASGRRRVCLRPFNDQARALGEEIRVRTEGIELYAADARQRLPRGVRALNPDAGIDATILLYDEGEELAAALMDYIDLEDGTLVAPITQRYFRNLPLFLISVPKAGTHLLLELARTMGYRDGGSCPDHPQAGYWYYVEYSNAHTAAPDFFVDTVRRSPFGNRAHPFARSPALFIYRNPLDIVVSEANYYHRDGNTAFAAYLAPLSDEERLLRLIDDPWLLGSIRDRVGRFAAWLDFGNVIPISFEELVGSGGGGSDEAQHRLIWSIQLKLQVPGDPETFARALSNTGSPTFRKGRIGGYRDALTPAVRERFLGLPQDFMAALGYAGPDEEPANLLPARAEEFRRRPVTLSKRDFTDTPVLAETGYLGYNLVAFRSRYYAVAADAGVIDLTRLNDEALAALPSAPDLTALKQHIFVKFLTTEKLADEVATRIYPGLRNRLVEDLKAWLVSKIVGGLKQAPRATVARFLGLLRSGSRGSR